jgi:hypothetical protein
MPDDPSLRMLAAFAATLIVGTWVRRKAAARARQWDTGPVAAQQRAMRAAKLSATGVAYISAALICFGVVLFVECVVAVVHSFS